MARGNRKTILLPILPHKAITIGTNRHTPEMLWDKHGNIKAIRMKRNKINGSERIIWSSVTLGMCHVKMSWIYGNSLWICFYFFLGWFILFALNALLRESIGTRALVRYIEKRSKIYKTSITRNGVPVPRIKQTMKTKELSLLIDSRAQWFSCVAVVVVVVVLFFIAFPSSNSIVIIRIEWSIPICVLFVLHYAESIDWIHKQKQYRCDVVDKCEIGSPARSECMPHNTDRQRQ